MINEYANISFQWKKENAIQKLGEEVGARLYEGMFFTKNKMDKKAHRKIKILPMLKYIKDDLWEVLFNQSAAGLEAFIGDRKHSKTNQELKEYVLYEYNPKYLLKYTKDNFLFKFFAAILKGFLCYAGFKCRVVPE